jgi:hypothetical protein
LPLEVSAKENSAEDFDFGPTVASDVDPAVASGVDPTVASAADPAVESGADPVESGADPVESGADPVESGADPVESGADGSPGFGSSSIPLILRAPAVTAGHGAPAAPGTF